MYTLDKIIAVDRLEGVEEADGWIGDGEKRAGASSAVNVTGESTKRDAKYGRSTRVEKEKNINKPAIVGSTTMCGRSAVA